MTDGLSHRAFFLEGLFTAHLKIDVCGDSIGPQGTSNLVVE